MNKDQFKSLKRTIFLSTACIVTMMALLHSENIIAIIILGILTTIFLFLLSSEVEK